MKYRVIKSFLDKNTRKPYNTDYCYETDNEARANELIAGGYIIPLGNAKKAANKATNKVANKATNENATETNVSESDTESDEEKKKTAKK